MKQSIRRRFLGATALAAVALMISACSGTPAAETPSTSGSGEDSSTTLEQTELTFSHSVAVPQLEKVPIHQTIAGLEASTGIKGTETFHQNGEDAVQAVARGESDFGTANAPTVFAAIKKGAPIKAIMTAYLPAYLVVATSDVKDPCDLDGKRVGIHSNVSATTLYTNLSMQDCEGIEPEILVVPGSAARVQAMLAGQLDASAVQFPDWLMMQKEAPGKFNVVYDVAKADLGIIDSVIFTNTDTIKNKPNFVKAFVGALQDSYAAAYEDEDALAQAILDIVPDMTEENAAELAKVSIEDKIWPADGGFSDSTIQTTLDALAESGLLTEETLPDAASCCDASFLK